MIISNKQTWKMYNIFYASLISNDKLVFNQNAHLIIIFKSIQDEHFNIHYAVLTNICIVEKHGQKNQKFELISTLLFVVKCGKGDLI